MEQQGNYVIGFGSLMNDPGSLASSLKEEWTPGPELPIALARKSKGRYALTRDLYPTASLESTRVCRFKSGVGLNDAIKAVREREGIPEKKKRFIGYINFRTGRYRCANPDVYRIIYEWGTRMGIDGVVWTDLPSNIDFGGEKRSIVVERMLRNDLTLLRNTKAYIRLIPEEMRSALEKRILLM